MDITDSEAQRNKIVEHQAGKVKRYKERFAKWS